MVYNQRDYQPLNGKKLKCVIRSRVEIQIIGLDYLSDFSDLIITNTIQTKHVIKIT